MIRRGLARLFAGWVGDDPNPEPSQLDEWDGVVVPALEPDVDLLPSHPGLREYALMSPEQRASFAADFRARRAAEDAVIEAERIAREAARP
jgi:hypothetical protein